MLDYKFIKDNLDAVKQNIINRNMTADADKVVELFDKISVHNHEICVLNIRFSQIYTKWLKKERIFS